MKWELRNKLNEEQLLKKKPSVSFTNGKVMENYIPSLFFDGLKIIHRAKMLKKFLKNKLQKQQIAELRNLQNLVGGVVDFKYESEESPQPKLLLMKVVVDSDDKIKYLEGINIKYSLMPLPKIKNYIEKNDSIREAYQNMVTEYPAVSTWYRKYDYKKITELKLTTIND